MAAAIEWAQERDLHKLSLSVFAHNEAAIALYRKFGFVEEGRRVKQYRRSSGEPLGCNRHGPPPVTVEPTNLERAFAARPEAFAAWQQLNGAIKARMDLRRYGAAGYPRRRAPAAVELLQSRARLGAARPVRRAGGGDRRRRDRRHAALDEVDIAVMDFAERVVGVDASSISEADLQPLREFGLSDEEIMDVVLAASARCFFSKTLDALCVLPDASYRDLPAEVRDALVVGRPIADA